MHMVLERFPICFLFRVREQHALLVDQHSGQEWDVRGVECQRIIRRFRWRLVAQLFPRYKQTCITFEESYTDTLAGDEFRQRLE